jgi:hypothetical protein
VGGSARGEEAGEVAPTSRRPARCGLINCYSATEVGRWQQLSRVSQNRAAVQLDLSGPLLLLLGLLTLLNAPFDWASLGLTRALLRRGLELGGWWPYLLAIADAALAALIVAALALTMVIGVQAFDALAQHGGGKAILPLDVLFDGIAVHPADPEYWWVYARLLTTVLPSMVNLMIGGASAT